MSYVVIITPRAQRIIRRLAPNVQRRILTLADHLAADPRAPGTEKLTGHDQLYRARSGDYRVIYEIDDDIVRVLILLVGHRRDVYRDLQRL